MTAEPAQLSTLPHEILNRILCYTTDKDLLCMGRLNAFYAQLSAPILKDRITRHVQNDGWKLYASERTRRKDVFIFMNDIGSLW